MEVEQVYTGTKWKAVRNTFRSLPLIHAPSPWTDTHLDRIQWSWVDDSTGGKKLGHSTPCWFPPQFHEGFLKSSNLYTAFHFEKNTHLCEEHAVKIKHSTLEKRPSDSVPKTSQARNIKPPRDMPPLTDVPPPLMCHPPWCTTPMMHPQWHAAPLLAAVYGDGWWQRSTLAFRAKSLVSVEVRI